MTEKKLITFTSYDRWRCTQESVEKYANRNPMKCKERNWAFILHFSVIDICVVHSDFDIRRQTTVVKVLLSQPGTNRWSFTKVSDREGNEKRVRSYNCCGTNFALYDVSKKRDVHRIGLAVVRRYCQRFVPPVCFRKLVL